MPERGSGWAVLVTALLIGCGAHHARPYERSSARVPAGVAPAELLQVADERARLGPEGPDLAGSLAAAEQALGERATQGEAAWRVARVLFHLADRARGEEAAELAARCIDASEIAVQHAVRAESFYYRALCLGARARARSVEGLELVRRMVAAGERALELDPKALHGGAHRLLGGVYLRAPAWPASVGDLDAAIEHLNAAVEIAPEWAENHVLLAEALLADDRVEAARAALEKGKRHLSNVRARGWRRLWSKDIAALERRLGRR